MDAVIQDLWHAALMTGSLVAAPFLGTALVLGLVASVIQAATQLQENVLAFVPKLVGICLALVLCGHFALQKLVDFGSEAIGSLAEIGGRPR